MKQTTKVIRIGRPTVSEDYETFKKGFNEGVKSEQQRLLKFIDALSEGMSGCEQSHFLSLLEIIKDRYMRSK